MFFKLKKINIITLAFVFLLAFGFLFSFNADAATCNNQNGITTFGIDVLSNPNGCPDLNDNRTFQSYSASIIKVFVNIILGFTSTIALVAFVYAGVIMLGSKGDAKKFKAGQSIITYTFMGVVIIIFSYAISNFLLTTVPNITKNTDSFAANDSGTTGSTTTTTNDGCVVVRNGYYIASMTSSCPRINNISIDTPCGGSSADDVDKTGKCKYVSKSAIDDVTSTGFPATLNLPDDTCGRVKFDGSSNNYCTTISDIQYCLRCVKN